MKLEEALNSESMEAIYRHSSGGNTIVDASWTFRNPHCKDEETYWVQKPHRITRQAYHSLEEVKDAVSYPDSKDWQPYKEHH